jgi:hypothetical protein
MKRCGVCTARSAGALAALALLAVVGIPGCGNRAEEAYRQVKEQAKARGNAAQALRDLGATVEEKAYMRGQKAWAVDLSGKQIPDDTFELLKKLGPVAELNLSNTNFTDAQAEKLNDPEVGGLLLKLNLGHTPLTDAGLEKLTKLFALKELVLTGTQVTPAGVERFRQERASNQHIPAMFKSPTIQF